MTHIHTNSLPKTKPYSLWHKPFSRLVKSCSIGHSPGFNLFSPIFLIVLMAICILAANSNYKVSISMADGFRFEPAQTQSPHT